MYIMFMCAELFVLPCALFCVDRYANEYGINCGLLSLLCSFSESSDRYIASRTLALWTSVAK